MIFSRSTSPHLFLRSQGGTDACLYSRLLILKVNAGQYHTVTGIAHVNYSYVDELFFSFSVPHQACLCSSPFAGHWGRWGDYVERRRGFGVSPVADVPRFICSPSTEKPVFSLRLLCSTVRTAQSWNLKWHTAPYNANVKRKTHQISQMTKGVYQMWIFLNDYYRFKWSLITDTLNWYHVRPSLG